MKPSDVVFGLALCASIFLLLRERREQTLEAARPRFILPLLVFLGSVLLATLVGYFRYNLTMSRDGIVFLTRLVTCMALFLAIHHLAESDATFAKRISLAMLSPAFLLPGVLIPAVSVSMWDDGRFRGLTVNPNTADLGISVGLALAYPLAIYEMNRKRYLHASCFAVVALGMLLLIVWTQSRAYLAGAFASMLLAALLAASNLRLPRLRIVGATVFTFFAFLTATLLLAPLPLKNSYVTRVALRTPPAQQAEALSNWRRLFPWSERPAQAMPPSEQQARTAAEPSSGQHGPLDKFHQVASAIARRLMANPHVQAAVYYSQVLVSNNYLGLGVNYEEKFFILFPWINTKHGGTNSIFDIPVYGGVGAVLSMGYLMVMVAKRTLMRLEAGIDGTTPYAMGATSALVGLWVAAVLLGSPIVVYQFWILTAVALI